jgi:hypothetical protein
MKRAETNPSLVREELPSDDPMAIKWKISRPGPPTHLGVTAYSPDKFWKSYTLACSFSDESCKLMDMEGHEVHRWEYKQGLHWHLAEMLPNGHVLAIATTGGYSTSKNRIQKIIELDWDSNLVWQEPTAAHHDFQRLANGNTLAVCHGTAVYRRISPGPLLYDYLQEITPGHKVVWEWHFGDHVDELRDLIHPLWRPPQSGGDYPHINTAESLPETPLGLRDERFRPGNILLSGRAIHTIFVVDRQTGAINWAWGPGTILGQHEPTMLENGNILLFDNGHGNGPAGGYDDRSYSSVVEMEPATRRVVWEYKADPPEAFASYVASGCQRLPNGNTFVCAANWRGGIGRLFEVTPQREIVWEYWNPDKKKYYRARRYPAELVEGLLQDSP